MAAEAPATSSEVGAVLDDAPSPVIQLLPQLPDDVSGQCIARVPGFFHPQLALVSRPWSRFLFSQALFATRLSAGATSPFLLLDVRTPSAPTRWYLLDRHPLNPRPLLPLPPPPLPASGSACATLGRFLFVLGGSVDGVPTSAVRILDTGLGRWRLGPRMATPREFAAAAAVDGRVYVVGGCLPTSEPWAEVLDGPDAPQWIPVQSPVHLREKWMHGNAVVDGKLLAVADRGGLLFDPAAGTWGPVPALLDMGWKGRAAVVGGIVYSYDFLGKIKGYDPAADLWREVEGVSKKLPRFLSGAALADLGGCLCVIWEGKRTKGRTGMEIMFAAIEVSKMDGGSSGWLKGEIAWTEGVILAVPKESAVSHCLAVQV